MQLTQSKRQYLENVSIAAQFEEIHGYLDKTANMPTVEVCFTMAERVQLEEVIALFKSKAFALREQSHAFLQESRRESENHV